MEGIINTTDFVNYLCDNNLVITSRNEVLNEEQIKVEMSTITTRKLLRKKWLSIREIVDHNLLGVTSRTGVLSILQASNKYDGSFKKIDGKYKVLTSFIKQLRDERAIV